MEKNGEEEKQSRFFGTQTIATPTYKEQAYHLIKEAIIYRRLQVGTVYSQDSLCTDLGISKTPVREALLELQKEGYLHFLRGRGILVQPVTKQRARDIVEMRFYIEQIGCRLAAERADDEHIEAIGLQMKAMQGQEDCEDIQLLYRLDRAFHRAIFEAAGNSCLLESVENLREQFLRVETQTAFDDKVKRRAIIAEHDEIYKAIRRHDAEAAEAAMKEHYECTYERTLKKALEEG